MTDQQLTGAAGAQPADDLRSALSAAIASRDGDTAGDIANDPVAQQDAPAGAVDEEAAAAPSDPAGTKQSDDEPETPPAAASAPEPPSNWKPADKDMFKALPEPARQFLLERHRAMHASHTRKMQAIAELKREYEPVDQVFAPHREIMRQRGLTPRALIEGWADVERRLADGDGVDVIKGIVAGYNIDPARVAQALGIGAAREATTTAASKPAAEAAASPQVPAQVLQEIARLRQRAEAEDRAKAEAARLSQAAAQQKFLSELDAFRNARDDQGNLLRPHFSDLEEDMAHLALAAKSRGQAIPPLQQLYDKAVRANPSTYEAQRIADEQSAQRRRQDEARAKAAAAKRAGSSITGAPGTGQPPVGRSSARSLREEIMAQLDESA
jgi:hypothetical protein